MTMTDTAIPSDELALIDLRAILDWLTTPAAKQPEDELAPLHAHLVALRETTTTAHQRHKVLDLLYARAHGVVQRLLPELTGVSLPLSRRTRQTVRGMQDVLMMIAEDYLNTLGDLDEHLIRGLRRPPELTLWRTLDTLACHLLISDYSASPATPGVWALLHRAYRLAVESSLSDIAAPGAEGTPREVYQRALLLACAQPASFTSREIDLVADYVRRFSSRANFTTATDDTAAEDGLFWVAPEYDAPPIAASRRQPASGAICLHCDRLAQLVEEQVTALEAGLPAATIDLPDAANTPTGIGVLRRLAHYWGHAGKRRFPRRRQNYRAVLCIGLPALWQLFQSDETQAGELSSWMVTNESPDGYALMHVSGKTSRIAPGDVVAIRTETISDWQICMVRWALSENPENLEIGLQILANRATPAVLACNIPGTADGIRKPVLILPQVPPLRLSETLIVPSGTVLAGTEKMVLMIERDNLELREVVATQLDEQTASVEVITIGPHSIG